MWIETDQYSRTYPTYWKEEEKPLRIDVVPQISLKAQTKEKKQNIPSLLKIDWNKKMMLNKEWTTIFVVRKLNGIVQFS